MHFCTFIVNIKRQQHCYEVENGITAIRSVPDFMQQNTPFKRV